MATAVLILNEARHVEYVNASAAAIFLATDAVGCSLPALLATCGAKGGETIFKPIDDGELSTEMRIHLADDRLLDGTLRSLSSGGFVLSLDDVTAYVRNAELARVDALTGLANRAAFGDRLGERLAHANRSAEKVAVLCVDLDRFKAINDTLGHPVGDALLRKVAERLKSAGVGADLIARLGGDEFAVIETSSNQPESAIALATRLVDLIGRTYVIDGHMLNIGASVGIAISPAHGLDCDSLLKNADLALYRAKTEGRGTFRLFENQMDEQIQARRSMELDLRRALALREMQLVYQPQVNIRTREVIGFEALVRWHQPQRGIVSPADFIPLAEDIGVITALGEWVLRSACRQAAAWPRPTSVAVNLSPLQFRGGKLLETVASALAHSRLPPGQLELEITEGALLDDTDAVIRTLKGIRALGVRISLDDFGTGYSSLGYLRKFSFSKVKIDQSFVRDIEVDPSRRAIVRAIVDLAAGMGMRTIAEGVETEAELACVQAQGCTEVQGYLTGRPLSAEAAEALLQPIHSLPPTKERDHE